MRLLLKSILPGGSLFISSSPLSQEITLTPQSMDISDLNNIRGAIATGTKRNVGGYAVGATRSDTSRGRQSLWKSLTHNFETLPSTMWVVLHETSGQRIVVVPSMSYIAFTSEPQLHVQTTTDCIA